MLNLAARSEQITLHKSAVLDSQETQRFHRLIFPQAVEQLQHTLLNAVPAVGVGDTPPLLQSS